MSTGTPGAIELATVSKSYGPQPVLSSASLTIERGQFVAIIGRSGSGKSTLLRLMGGLEAADSGAVRIDGTDLSALTEAQRARHRRKDLGFVFQFFNLIPTLTVGENVELPLALNEVPRAALRERTRTLLAELGLAGRDDAFPEDLSGGEQQRVAIARAVVHEPKFVLADEPTGNLDVETAGPILELLRRTCLERRATLVVATHSNEVAALAQRVISIRGGQIVDVAP